MVFMSPSCSLNVLATIFAILIGQSLCQGGFSFCPIYFSSRSVDYRTGGVSFCCTTSDSAGTCASLFADAVISSPATFPGNLDLHDSLTVKSNLTVRGSILLQNGASPGSSSYLNIESANAPVIANRLSGDKNGEVIILSPEGQGDLNCLKVFDVRTIDLSDRVVFFKFYAPGIETLAPHGLLQDDGVVHNIYNETTCSVSPAPPADAPTSIPNGPSPSASNPAATTPTSTMEFPFTPIPSPTFVESLTPVASPTFITTPTEFPTAPSPTFEPPTPMFALPPSKPSFITPSPLPISEPSPTFSEPTMSEFNPSPEPTPTTLEIPTPLSMASPSRNPSPVKSQPSTSSIQETPTRLESPSTGPASIILETPSPLQVPEPSQEAVEPSPTSKLPSPITTPSYIPPISNPPIPSPLKSPSASFIASSSTLCLSMYLLCMAAVTACWA